ncbi:peptidoglycan-binding protein [Cystobacter fuscus]|nr:peptidoglycan-binding protein [Cystobacter fuscus]
MRQNQNRMKPNSKAVASSVNKLQLGSKGSAVEELQRRLQIAGLFKGTADGFYGSKTIESVKLLQSRLRLPIDGVVSDNTWKTLTGNPESTLQCMNSPTTALFNSLKAAIVPVNRVKVWWNTFIPMAKVDGPPGSECFTGDGRGFSNEISASHRTHQEIEVEVSSLKQTINWKHVGATHEVDCSTGAVESSDTAPTSELTNGPVSRSGSLIGIKFKTAASNPLVTFAPAIDSDVTFLIDPIARTCSLSGKHDGFPAYEAYVAVNSGAGVLVYGYNPLTTGQGIGALFPPMDISAAISGVKF